MTTDADRPSGQEEEEDGLEMDDRQSEEIRQIFGTTFPQYLLPVEEVIAELLVGKGDSGSIETLGGVLSSLGQAASRMGFADVHAILQTMQALTAKIDRRGQGPLPEEVRTGLQSAIRELKRLSAAMAGGSAPREEEPQQTLLSLLRGKPGIGDLVLRRLSAAGVVTVDQLRMAQPEELMVVAGLDRDMVDRLIGLIDGTPRPPVSSPASAPPAPPAPEATEVLGSRDKIVESLNAEKEAEALLTRLRAEVRDLRAEVTTRRELIQLLEEGTREVERAAARAAAREAEEAGRLATLRARRGVAESQLAALDEAVGRKEQRVAELLQQRAGLEAQVSSLRQDLCALLESLEVGRHALG